MCRENGKAHKELNYATRNRLVTNAEKKITNIKDYEDGILLKRQREKI